MTIDSEYKIKYEKDLKTVSFLGSSKKAEMECEYTAKNLGSEDRKLKLSSKMTFTPKPMLPPVAEKKPDAKAPDKPKCCLWCQDFHEFCDVATEVMAKASLQKNLWHTLKFNWNNSCAPKMNFMNMVEYKNILLGINYKFNKEAPKMTDSLEVLLGFKRNNNFMAYLTQ